MIVFKQFFSKLKSKTDYESKKDYLKSEYPGVFINYCKHFDMHEELDKYIAECLKLRNAGVGKYAQYIFGGVIPTIEI